MIRLCTFASDITPPVGHPLCAGWYPPARAIGGPLQALGPDPSSRAASPRSCSARSTGPS